MPLNYVTLICDLFDGSGAAISRGAVTFTPSVQLTDSIDQELIPQAPVQAFFRAGLAAPQVTLLATDNANVAPSGWGWQVTFQNVPGNPASFNFFLPFASGATQHLSKVSPVSSVTTMAAFAQAQFAEQVFNIGGYLSIQAALNAAQANGGGKVTAAPNGAYSITAPLRIPSNTWLDMTGATVTLLQNSSCNMLQSWAVQANTRVVDAVTNSTTTLTSATAGFTAANVGNVLRVYYRDGTFLDTTIAGVTNSTTVTLAAAATHSQTGLTCYFGAGRDSNIKVTGGNWVRQANNATGGQNGWDSSCLRFRHVDGLEVGGLTGTVVSGKYFVNPGDCTNFYIHDILTASTMSDTVHVNGPALNGNIQRISGLNSGDDIVSLTCADFHGVSQWMGDTMGNIIDITVRDVYAAQPTQTTTARGVLIQAGQSLTSNGFTIDRIRVSNVRVSLNNYPVDLTPDTDINTQGGTYGYITVDGVSNTAATPPGGAVVVRSPVTVTDLEVRNVQDFGGSAYLWVETGATVTRLLAIGIEPGFVSLQGTVTTARLLDAVSALNATQTFTGQNTFAGSGTTPANHWYGAVITDDITVVPNGAISTSASVFLDNLATPTNQVWEFGCDATGHWYVFDKTASHQIIQLDAGAAANAIHVDNGNIYIGTTFRCQAGAQFTNGIQYQRVLKTASYSASSSADYIIGCDTVTNNITITLPNINWAGQVYVIKDETGHAATHNITVTSAGGLLIDGAASVTIGANYGALRVYSTGSGWATW